MKTTKVNIIQEESCVGTTEAVIALFKFNLVHKICVLHVYNKITKCASIK